MRGIKNNNIAMKTNPIFAFWFTEYAEGSVIKVFNESYEIGTEEPIGQY